MSKIIVIYSFEKISAGERKQFHRKLFGSIEKTHGGRYSTEIKGLLTNNPHERLINSVFLTDSKFESKIKKVLDYFSAKYWIYHIDN